MSDGETIARWTALIEATTSPVALAWVRRQLERKELLDRLGGAIDRRAEELEAEGFDIEPYGLKGDKAA